MKIILTIILALCFIVSVKAQDTTITVRRYKCDSVETVHIAQKTTTKDTTVQILTGYSRIFHRPVYKDSTYKITTIVPAHDSTFVCKLCGTCTARDTVIVSNSGDINGIFVNTGTLTPLADRIHTAKLYHCNAFRINMDVGGTWVIKQIKDSGMIPLMTYNHPACCSMNYFPTGTALTNAKASLHDYLSANNTASKKPMIMSFNNEEPNTNYWKGTPQSYMAWLNIATDSCHKYNIPTSNGGLLQSIIYYIRWVYQNEGNTAMVNLINAQAHLYPGPVGTAAQAVIDWNKIEIPALASSKVDYINYHHYEPAYGLAGTSDTSSGTLPIIINFLHERTEKPVIITEFGSKYHHQGLFNDEANEINNNDVNIRVYYYGYVADAFSDPNPNYWKQWIDAHP